MKECNQNFQANLIWITYLRSSLSWFVVVLLLLSFNASSCVFIGGKIKYRTICKCYTWFCL